MSQHVSTCLDMSQLFRTHHPRLGSLSQLARPMEMWGNAPPPAASLALGVLRVADGRALDHCGNFVGCTPGYGTVPVPGVE